MILSELTTNLYVISYIYIFVQLPASKSCSDKSADHKFGPYLSINTIMQGLFYCFLFRLQEKAL